MASTPPPSTLSPPIHMSRSTPDPLLSSPDTPQPPFTPGSSSRMGSTQQPVGRPPPSPSHYKSSARPVRVQDSLHRRGSASDEESAMDVEVDKSLGDLALGFAYGSGRAAGARSPSSSASRAYAPSPRLATPLVLSQASYAPASALPSSSLSIVVPSPSRAGPMDLVLDEEEAAAVEAEEDGGEEAAPLPTEEEIGALEERLQELNVEYGLEDEEGDDEHREMAGLRQIYTATAPLLPKLKSASSARTKLDAQAAEITSLQRIIDVQGDLARKASEEQRAMFDVERDGWKAETQILLTKVKTGGPSGLGQIWVSNADEQPQPPNPKQPQAGPSHKKESGFEQLDKVGPEDYNKLLKQWMDLQAEHRKSIAEKTAMTYKMRNHEGQIKALTQELHFLRPIAMNGRRPAQPSLQAKSSPPTRTHSLPPLVSPPQPQSRRQTLGDARSEHLLLAARRLRTLREKNPEIGLITAAHYNYASLSAPDPNATLEPYPEGASELDDDDGAKDRTPRGKPRAKGKKATSGSMAPPKTPISASAKGKSRRKDEGAVQRTPGGSIGTPGRGFEELLAAAQSLQHPTHPTSTLRDAYAEPPANSLTPTGPPDSPKRRRVGGAGVGWVPGATAPGPSGEVLHTSALDLLALASSHDPASPAPSSSVRLGGLLGSGGSDNEVGSDGGRSAGSASRGLEPAFALRSDPDGPFGHSFIGSDPPLAGPSTTPRDMRLPPDGSSPYLATQTPSALPQRVKEEFAGFASDSSSQSPPAVGVAPLDNGTSAVPARRVRSPYLKWNPDEDELLARGVAKYGQKWDLVSKAVPTRSYHQCRQRWLRKLGMFDHKSAAVTQAAAGSGAKHSSSAAPPESPSRRKGVVASDGPSTSESASADSN